MKSLYWYFYGKKEQPDSDFWIYPSSRCSREALWGAEKQRWGFPEQQPLSHPAQLCQCKKQPENGATALNCPRGYVFSRELHIWKFTNVAAVISQE